MIGRQQTVIRVFVGSPGDLAEERSRLDDVVRELNLTWSRSLGVRLEVVKWETDAYPAAGPDAQAVLNEEFADDYEIFIGIFWTRLGAETPRAQSGTVEEFERALNRRRAGETVQLMLYFKDAPVAPTALVPQQLQKLIEFRERLKGDGILYWSFLTGDEFSNYSRLHLTKLVQEWLAKNQLPKPPVASSLPSPVAFPDQVPIEELGFIELLELANERMQELLDVAKTIAAANTDFGRKLEQRTKEIVDAKSNDPALSLREYKRVTNYAANDMEELVSKLGEQTPKFSKLYPETIDLLSRAATQLPEFGGEYQGQLASTIETLRGLRLSMEEPIRVGTTLRDTIAGLPRVTVAFNHAKRRTVAALDSFLGELRNAITLTAQAEESLKGLLPPGASDNC